MRSALPTVFLAIAPALIACAGLVGASTLHDVRVIPDGCGNFVVRIDAEAPGRRVRILVDGNEEDVLRVDGRATLRWLGSAPAGSTPTVTVELGDRFGQVLTRSTSTVIPPYADTVRLELDAPRLFHGQPAGITLSAADACADLVSPRWSARVDTTPLGDGTMLPSNRSVHLTLPDHLAEGPHTVYATVTVSPFRTEEAAVDVFVEPPCTDLDADGVRTCDGDCDDGDPAVGACTPANPKDMDGDGFLALVHGGTDCHDNHSRLHPRQAEGTDADGDGFFVRDGLDNDCDGLVDEELGPGDCDDTRADVNPSRPESSSPNGRDDNCDGRVDEDTVAFDDDGDGYAELEGDCDDGDPLRAPGLAEIADCRDQDCDGAVDEGVAWPTVDDAFEPNDGAGAAHDLATHGRNKFSATLDLVTRDTTDEEWFTFWSSDGLFDTWGITATLARVPDNARYEVSVIDAHGAVRARRTLAADGDAAQVRGRGGASDSGMYLLRVRPLATPRPYCPLTVRLSSR